MNSSTWFMFAVLAIALVQSRRIDQGPQVFALKTPTIQYPQKRATKEVVVYLTPSQIAAIQEGRGFISAQPIEETAAPEEIQEETEQTQQEQEDASESNPPEADVQNLEEEDSQVPSSIPVEEPNVEEENEEEPQYSWVQIKPTSDKKFVPSSEDNFAYLRLYPETETQTEEAQIEESEKSDETETSATSEESENLDVPEDSENTEESGEGEESSEEIQTEAPKQQRYKLVPYEDATEKSEPTSTAAPQEEPIRERWLRLLEQNRSQFRKALPAQKKATLEPESTLSKLRYLAKYNDQRQAIENEEKRKKSLSGKQKSRKVSLETRTKNLSAPVIKEVTKNQLPAVKRAKVSTPVVVPAPEPIEVSQTLPIPLEIFRPVADLVAKAKKNSAKKSTSTVREGVEKRALSPKKLSAPIEKTYVLERRAKNVPSSKPERITVIRQYWEK